MSLMFFVLKKDGKKRMVQDYQYLNSWTIKNNYPLLLISDLIYRQVIFSVLEGTLMVMFFELTNSLVTF